MEEEQRALYLVDGSSYIHRAYHAIRDLSSSKGLPTNAIFGFTKMLIKLMEEKRPKYLAVVFDAKGPTFRHELFKEYKSTRPPMPDDLVEQIPYIKRIIDGFNIVSLEKEGYEADDIIGSLARKGEKEGFEVVIVSGDKDFRQIISPNISMWDPMKDKVIDYDSFRKEYQIEPEQMVDVMGLSGDSSDNIPGVPGVGEKTALSLVKEYGSIDGVYENIEEIKKKKLKENLLQSKELAYISKELVRIKTDLEIIDDLKHLKVKTPNREILSELFRELEFKSLWDQFVEVKEEEDIEYNTCGDEKTLTKIIQEIKKKGTCSIDTETTSQDPMKAKLVGISISWEKDRAYYIPIAHKRVMENISISPDKAISMIKGVFEDKEIKKIGQNIKYDAIVLRRHGIELEGIDFDTMVASYVIDPGHRQHNLDYLASKYLNHKMISYHDVVGKGKKEISFSEVPIDEATRYACEDVDITLKLKDILEAQLERAGNRSLFYDLEMKLISVLIDMEWAGIKLDIDVFKDMSIRYAEQLKRLEEEIYKEAGMEFNINSSQQLGYVLFEKLKLPVQRKTTKTKSYSTDVKVLKKLTAYPFRIPELLLKYRTISKLKSTYLDSLIKMVNPETGRVHTSFNQTATATGRLSSSNPNLQNIPVRGEEGREIRQGFVPEEGNYFISADYSQIELRIFAHYSGDPAFIKAFQEDVDIHSATASEIMGVDISQVTPDMRRMAKAINFGIIYGMGARKLSEELGIPLKEAQRYIDAYYNRYEGVKRYREDTIKKAREKGYVCTLFSRRRYLTGINHSKQRLRAEAERMAINTPIQGTAADLIKKAMINIHERMKREGFKAKMILQVHDELLFEVPEHEVELIKKMVKEEMEGVYQLLVPLKVDIGVGRNWDEAH